MEAILWILQFYQICDGGRPVSSAEPYLVNVHRPKFWKVDMYKDTTMYVPSGGKLVSVESPREIRCS